MKVLKAFYHHLIRLYGPIAIVDKNLEPVGRRGKAGDGGLLLHYVLGLDEAIEGDWLSRGASFMGQDLQIAKAIKAEVLQLGESVSTATSSLQ